MDEFWEETFKNKQEMWGLNPAKSTILTKDFFIENGVKIILIPGIGYGRNAQIFRENSITVTGIEISETAIALGKKHFGTGFKVYHGSVTDMPFDNNLYDGIYCYGLIYLLNQNERKKLIENCYDQLTEGGFMVYAAITKESDTFGQGRYLSKDRYEMFGGVKIFFYDNVSIKKEFGAAGLIEVTEVTENYPFYLIKCKKTDQNKTKGHDQKTKNLLAN